MLRVLFDEDFNARITRGVRAQLADGVGPSVVELGKSGTLDPDVIAFAAAEDRVIITHDANTMTAHFFERIARAEPSTGLIVVSTRMAIGDAIAELVFVLQASARADFNVQPILYLPLR